MTLSTPSCSPGGGGRRQANERELAIFKLWDERGLNDAEFAPGNLIVF